MINLIIDWSVKHRFLVLLLGVLIIGIGVFSIKQTAIDAIPDLSDVQVIIKTSYPGQSPQVVQDQVTYPLSTAMLSVPGALTVRGFSFFGDSYVYVLFDEKTDLYWARSRVLSYLSQVTDQLPDQARAQLGPDSSGVGWVYMYALVDRSGGHDLSELRSVQDWFLRYELQTVKGVSEVANIGGMVKQYQVTVDPQKLKVYNIPLVHINMAIQQGNGEIGASVIEMAEAEYMVNTNGYITGIDDLKDIPLGVSIDGVPLLLKDVAQINLGPAMRRGIAELNGDGEAVGGVVIMRHGENAQKVIENVKQKINQLEKSLPVGVELVTVYDRSQLIESAVDHLWYKLLEELVIVVLVCLVFLLHFRSSLVIIISLPMGILVAFIIMYFQGISANIMSLGGIAIAIGAMVDGAIVMVENMHKHCEKTPLTSSNRWKIVLKSTQEVGPALFFSLLIITVSFMPVFTLQAQEGRMFAPLAYTKTYAMAAAAVLSITLVPILMGYFVSGKIITEKRNPINRFLRFIYRPILQKTLKFPEITIVITLLLSISMIFPINKIGSEFIPSFDEGDLMYMPTTYPGISTGKARQILQQTNQLIKTVPEVETVFGKVGRAETATDPAPLNMIETFIQLKPKSEWRAGLTKVQLKEQLNEMINIPGLSNAWVEPIKTRIDMLATGVKTPIGIKIAGAELTVIEEIGGQLEDLLKDITGTVSVYSEKVAAGRYIKIDIKRQKAARYGLNVAEIQAVITSAIGGKNVTQTTEGIERYSVNVRYPQHYRGSLKDLQNLPILTEQKQHLLLADVADINIELGPSGIKSENARLIGWSLIDVKDVDVSRYIKQANDIIEQKLNLPSGYSITWSGQYEYLQRAKDRLMYIIPLTLMIIIILLYVNFGRSVEVLIIMMTLPIAMVGGVWLLYILGYNFSVAVVVGFIALAGVAVETAVIMLTYLNQALVAHQLFVEDNKKSVNLIDLTELIIDGACRRIRPVVMTAVSIIIGLLPILFADGIGSEVMNRIAAPMIGGMFTAMILVLFVLPAIYFLYHKHRLIKKPY